VSQIKVRLAFVNKAIEIVGACFTEWSSGVIFHLHGRRIAVTCGAMCAAVSLLLDKVVHRLIITPNTTLYQRHYYSYYLYVWI